MRRALCAAGALTLLAGESSDPAGPSSRAPDIASASLATPRRVRRLSDVELDNVVERLVGMRPKPSAAMVKDVRVDGYDVDESFLVSDPKLDGYVDRAQELAPLVVAAYPCVANEDANACADRTTRVIAQRAFGRPATEEQIADLRVVYATGAQKSPEHGRELVAQAILLAPSTLYRSEIGAPPKPGEVEVRLDDWEIASQLSFVLEGTRPDDELLAAAARGELRDPAHVRAQAERLVRGPLARAQMRRFAEGWLKVGRFATVKRGAAEFRPSVRDAMVRELGRFIDHTVFDNRGSFDDLLLSSTTYPDPELAFIYGTDLLDPPAGDQAARLDPAHRRGVLSLPIFLTNNASLTITSPVERGLFVRVRMLCQDLRPPPADALTRPLPANDKAPTTREKFRQHTEDGRCQGCHKMIDPLGFGFEGFGLIGRRRTEENGFPIDDSGRLDQADVEADFHGPAELSVQLAKSQAVRRCFLSQMYRFAEGRPPTDYALEPLAQSFEQNQRRVVDLLVAYVTRPEFFVRRVAWEYPR